MRRSILSLLFSFCLLLPLCFAVSADGLPFAQIDPPQDMTFVLSYPNEGNECIEAVYAVPTDLCRVTSVSADLQDQLYGTAFVACVQFDWAVDDVKAFHYDESWDTTESDSPIRPITGSFVEKSEVLWFEYETDRARCDGALQTQTVQIVSGGSALDVDLTKAQTQTAQVCSFDFSAHKLFVRARFFVYEDKTGATHFSAWTKPQNVASCFGKDEKLTEKSVDAPLLSHAADEGNGTYSFEVAFTDAFRETARLLKSTSDTELNFEAQVRTDGGEWMAWLLPDTLYPYHVGHKQFTVPSDYADKKIEFRCRETGGNPDFGTDVTTAWSSILVAENGKVQIVENDDPFDEKVLAAERAAAEKEANRCKLCGFCPHPLGLCIFLWLGILAVIALIVWRILAGKKKQAARQAEIEARRAASAEHDADKTKSFVLTDSIKLQTDQDGKPEKKTDETPEEKPDEEVKQDEN